MHKKYSLVWYTKYRKPILHGSHAYRIREVIREVCAENEITILQGRVKKEQINLTVLAPMNIPLPKLMQNIKGKAAYIMLKESGDILGRPLWEKGYFARELK